MENFIFYNLKLVNLIVNLFQIMSKVPANPKKPSTAKKGQPKSTS